MRRQMSLNPRVKMSRTALPFFRAMSLMSLRNGGHGRNIPLIKKYCWWFRNPAPVDMENIPLFTGFLHPSCWFSLVVLYNKIIHGGSSPVSDTQLLRIFQHSPGTYPRPPAPTLYEGRSFHLGVALGMPGVCDETGVCWSSLRSTRKGPTKGPSCLGIWYPRSWWRISDIPHLRMR